MNASRLMIVAALSAVAFGAQADEADGSQFANNFQGNLTRAEVQAQRAVKGPNVWSTQYNPLAYFKSQTTRDQVRADYIANREAVAAFNSEDSGSSYLAQHDTPVTTRLAGTPVNAQ